VPTNDSDPNHLSLSAVLVSGLSNGAVTLNSSGSFLYTPKAGWTGSDSFQYYATDGRRQGGVAGVTSALFFQGLDALLPDDKSLL
jgi:hypothetical protein